MKIIKMNRDRRGTTIKAIERKNKTPLFIHVTVIIVIISLFVTSSGCAKLTDTAKPEIEIMALRCFVLVENNCLVRKYSD